MKGTSRTFLIVLAMATILATVTVGAAVAGKCGHGNNPNCSGGGTSGGSGGTIGLVYSIPPTAGRTSDSR